MNFLIQVENGLPAFDFGFELIQAANLRNLMHPSEQYKYELVSVISSDEKYADWIPVGSLEFVYAFLDIHHGISKRHIKPINIPEQLRKPEFLGRRVEFLKSTDGTLDFPIPYFVKSNDSFKGVTDMVFTKGSTVPVNEELLISELLDVRSEYRVFVQSRMIAGVKHYAEDMFVVPDEKAINAMIDAYTDCPHAYTLDVAVTDEGTFLLEVHPMVSCGLYGFKRHNLLPSMIIQGFRYMLNEAKKEKRKEEVNEATRNNNHEDPIDVFIRNLYSKED